MLLLKSSSKSGVSLRPPASAAKALPPKKTYSNLARKELQ
jgi:hypothetical protein